MEWILKLAFASSALPDLVTSSSIFVFWNAINITWLIAKFLAGSDELNL